ncbi:MAG: hypothetical protein QNM02_05820 [Acidimicrobiia bacterium]|nr:hypothetical protein [Acidimicrobiia bacterium]
MDSLVLGHPSAERSALQALLSDAGHEVSVCHDQHWGCVGLEGTCPLDEQSVDVAIAVAEPGDRFDAQGLTCVHRARIPIVTVGARRDDPVLDYSTVNSPRVDQALLTAIESAALDTTGHRRAIEQRLHDHLRSDEHVVVSVERSARQLDVLLTADLDPARVSVLADVARHAARGYDRHVDVIDVSVTAASDG